MPGTIVAPRHEEFEIRRFIPNDHEALLDWPPDQGLRADEARLRRERFGTNRILETAEPAWRALVRETVRDPMLWFLLATGGLYALLGERAEAWTLLVAALPLITMDAYLHRRTQASIEGLRSRLVARANAMRDGHWISLASEELVPGDLVRVRASEPFPADGIVIAGDALQVDESTLTGESYPVRKRPFARSAERAGARQGAPSRSIDAVHWGQAGTRLLTGEALLRVLATGGETLYGEIVRSSRQSAQSRTPLQTSVGTLVRGLVVAASLLCLCLAVVRLQQGFGWADALVSALTLAVAALPEEFPVVLAVYLGVGAYRLARRKALVRRSASVENIGRVTCICSDKTGTITRGELQQTHLLARKDSSDAGLSELAARASRAESGDPLDVAILRACTASGLRATAQDFDAEVVATFPFTEDRRRETIVMRSANSTTIAVTKGAPELILSLCTLEGEECELWERQISDWANEGHKVIACASIAQGAGEWSGEEPVDGLRFEGLLAFEDPVREGVADAVAQCREAGIHVVMVTGDHRATASAVARQIGLGGDAPRIISGTELEALVAGPDPASVAGFDLVVRAMPAQKLALVRALQSARHIVAVTGDGVNDVPALQAADIGIAMSEGASRSAREAASIVLLDDCFATIVAAIAEGRQLFRNLELSFRYLLMVHIPLVLTAALIPLAGFPLLFQPIHIVWLELVIHPTALLAFQELPAPGRLAATRARSGSGLLSPLEWTRTVLVGGMLAAWVSWGFVRGLGAAGWIEHGRSLALASLCIASAATIAGLSRLRTRASRWIVAGTMALSVLLIQTPGLAGRLHVTPLHLEDWTLAALGGALVCLPLLLEAARTPSSHRSVIRRSQPTITGSSRI